MGKQERTMVGTDHTSIAQTDARKARAPRGEVGARADEVVRRLRGINGDVPIFFERAFFASARCPLARDRTRCRKIPCTKHRQSERARLRKQPVPAGDPILERHASFGRKIKTEIRI
jgi:hypothetical protein